MGIKAVLFDLDGTLLPMDQSVFIKEYMGSLVKYLSAVGCYDVEKLKISVWKSIVSMMKNDGSKINETAFWDSYAEIYGEKARDDEKVLRDFYEKEFDKVRVTTWQSPMAKDAVKMAKSLDLRVVLATNPVFPRIATDKRVIWADLDPSDFSYITSYENSRYSKPRIEYYTDLIQTLSLSAEECLMVGNDTTDDMIAEEVGAKVFLLTDCLINEKNFDISRYPHGGYSDLIKYMNSLV